MLIIFGSQVVEKFQSGKFLVKVKNGLLIIHEYEGKISLGDVLDNGSMKIKQFPLNSKGYHDMEVQ